MECLHEFLMALFEVRGRICSDSAAYIERLNRLYGRFRIEADDLSPRQPVAEFTVLTNPSPPQNQPSFTFNGKTWSLRHPALVEGFTYEQILMELMSRVQSHILIHAGVVERDQQALLIVAESGFGKTTLTLELVRRGFRFLSDEFAAINRQNGQVYPCPRSLRIRPQTLELIGRTDLVGRAEIWMQKYMLDIEELYPGRLGCAAPIRTVLVLEGPKFYPGQVAQAPFLEIQVDHAPESFLDDLRKIEGVNDVDVQPATIGVILRLAVERKVTVLRAVEALCQAHEVLLLNVVHKPERPPFFSERAEIKPMSRSEAIMALLDQFLPGPRSLIVQEDMHGSPTQLFFELGSAIQGADCYRMRVGPLDEMANLVSSVTS